MLAIYMMFDILKVSKKGVIHFFYVGRDIMVPHGTLITRLEGVSLMRTLIQVQKKLYPDLLEVMQQRYVTLHNVNNFQPIGRRGLAEYTGLTERVVRSEVSFLQKQGLIDVTSKGMFITNEGKVVVDQLAVFMRDFMGLNVLEKKIKDKLQISHVIVVPGNSDEFDWVKQEMGKECVSFLKSIAKPESIIAVTGGTTMGAVAHAMVPIEQADEILFVPARGAIGERVENQSNTIAAEMARKSKGDYRLLHVPDPLSEVSYQTMINEPSINETLQIIKSSNVVIHGIGDALRMAERRKATDRVINKLKEHKAVSEAFGYYFDQDGRVVHKVRTIGIQTEDLITSDTVITVAGGFSKAKAIISYFKQGKSDLLITDEAAAQQILRDNSL